MRSKIKSKIKYIINIGIILLFLFGLVIYMIKKDGIENIINVTESINVKWALVGIFCMVIYWVLETLVLYIICKKISPKQKYVSSFRINMVGQLFNNITPFSSGGQPVQAYLLTKEGYSLSTGASILLFKFIIFQAVHVVYTFIVLIFKYEYFKSMIDKFAYFAIIGFLVNLFVIVMLILIGVNKKLAYSIFKSIYIFLSKIHIIKNVDAKLDSLKISIDNFNNQFKIIKKEKTVLFKAIVITIIQLTVFFTVAYSVYRSLGFDNNMYINILCAQAFLTMIMAFIPTPGAGGVAEGGFYVIFSHYFTSNTISMATFLWRFYTFYLPIIVGMFFVFKVKKKDNIQSGELVEKSENNRSETYE